MKKFFTILLAAMLLTGLVVSCNDVHDTVFPYTVTFDSNGGTKVDSIEVFNGNKVSKPTDPKNGDYFFGGWCKDEGLTEYWDFDNDVVTKNTTLYANWIHAVCFTAKDNSTITMKYSGSKAPEIHLLYSKEGINWTVFSNQAPQEVTLSSGENVYFKAGPEGNSYFGCYTSKDEDSYWSFVTNGDLSVSGNIMYLLNDKMTTEEQKTLSRSNTFEYLFSADDASTGGGITDASGLILPATTLSYKCYMNMFKNNKKLTIAPELPAGKDGVGALAGHCYDCMFMNCESLTEAPELTAKTLADYCYQYMFIGCKGLQKAPELPATILAEGCYSGMFIDCTGLTEAPELKAETLVKYCYLGMFKNCSNLKSITVYFGGSLNNDGTWKNSNQTTAEFATFKWLLNVSSTGTFTCPYELQHAISSMTEGSGNTIPEGWKVVNLDN